jgi:hypothetical protein
MKVPAEQLPALLGIPNVAVLKHPAALSLTDTALA